MNRQMLGEGFSLDELKRIFSAGDRKASGTPSERNLAPSNRQVRILDSAEVGITAGGYRKQIYHDPSC